MINGHNFSVNSPTGYSHSKKNIYIFMDPQLLDQPIT